MMERSKKKNLYGLIIALALICAAVMVSVSATRAYAWYDWDKHDAPIITETDLNDSTAYDANGYRTTVKEGAWGYGVRQHSYSDAAKTTTVKTTGNSALINRTELDLTGGKAAKVTYKSAGGGLWLTLATQAMYTSGHRLNPSGNEGKGMPVSIRLDEGAVYHTEYNGFGDAGSGKTEVSGLDTTAAHDIYIYAGTGTAEDFSFVMVDDEVFKVPALNISTFAVEDGGETYYPAYMYFYATSDAQDFELSAPQAVAKPKLPYMIDMTAEVRADIGKTFTISYEPNSGLAADYPDSSSYKWSSADTSIATVDENTGVITPVSGGTVQIKCYVTDKNDATKEAASKECKVTVCAYDEGGWLTNGNPAVWGGAGITPNTHSYNAADKTSTFTTGASNMTWNKTALNLDNGPVHFTVNIGASEDMASPSWIMFNLMNAAQYKNVANSQGDLVNIKDGNPGKIAFYYDHDGANVEKSQVGADSQDSKFPVTAGKDSEVVIYVGAGEDDKSFVSINGYKVEYNATLADFATETDGEHIAYIGLWPGKRRVTKVSELKTSAVVLLNTQAQSLEVGGEATLTAEVVTKGSAADVTWASGDQTVATVSGGKITALKAGKTVITATADGYTAQCAVEVTDITVEKVELDKRTATVKVGETLELTATISPANVTEEVTYEWTNGGKTSVATYKVNEQDASKVTVTAVGEGIVTIKVDCNGETAECIITVTAADPVKPADNGKKSGCSGAAGAGSAAAAAVIFAAAAVAVIKGRKRKAE